METNELDKVAEILSLFRLERIFLLVLGFFIMVAVVRFLNRGAQHLYKQFPTRRLLILQIVTMLGFALYIFGTIILLFSVLRPGKELLVALGGSMAVAIGFSLKDIVASIIAGLILLFDRPFQVGDRVTFGSIYGEIKSIGLRTVRLMTLNDDTVTIPNSKFITDAVFSGNAGALEMMVPMDFHLALDVNVKHVRDILHEIVMTSRFVFLRKPVRIVVCEVCVADRIALKFSVKAYVLDVQYEKAFETDVVTRVSEAFNKYGIKRPLRDFQLLST